MTREEDLLGIGYSFGFTGFNADIQKAIGTIRVETKQCILAYLPPGDLYYIMEKHKNKIFEHLRQIQVSSTSPSFCSAYTIPFLCWPYCCSVAVSTNQLTARVSSVSTTGCTVCPDEANASRRIHA